MNTKSVPDCVIIIPVYQKNLSRPERASLVQVFRVLSAHSFVFIIPQGLDLSEYNDLIEKYDVSVQIVSFELDNFVSVHSYSNLMLTTAFYEQFSTYDFMLIYQLDAWVFRDELAYWCAQGYDYIGAPWFENWHKANESSNFMPVGGNGGFSLRKIPTFIETLAMPFPHQQYVRKGRIKNKFLSGFFSKKEEDYTVETVFKKALTFEDYLFAKVAPTINLNFNVAPPEQALKFAFEAQPRRLYEMNSQKLPFGCHAFERYDFDFWKDKINIDII